jgi:glutathione S-transferase
MLLHHYPYSPFAEKIRALLGYKQLPWTSVEQPSVMPKNDMQALTGGYRRIPILQIGADIYCDTFLIAQKIESLAPQPTAFAQAVLGQANIVAQWADSTVFAAAMAYNFSPTGAGWFFKDTAPEQARAFAEDRRAMRGGGARMNPAEATPAYANYIERISQLLADKPFLFGDQPNIADFACYHPLWFTLRMPPVAGIFDATPNIAPWLARMMAFGHASARDHLTSAQALAVAKAASPAELPKTSYLNLHGIELGSQVSITAESFGLEATYGRLVHADATHFVLSREHDSCGLVHVHFPRIGFVLKPIA